MKHLQGSGYYHANLEEWTNVDGLQDRLERARSKGDEVSDPRQR
jgi:hypothetical protein